MSNKITREQLNNSIELCNESIQLFEQAQKLKKNRLYKEVIEKNYIEKEPLRLTKALAQGNVKGDMRELYNIKMQAVGHFAVYMDTLEALAMQAENQLETFKLYEDLMGNSDYVTQEEIQEHLASLGEE